MAHQLSVEQSEQLVELVRDNLGVLEPSDPIIMITFGLVRTYEKRSPER